MPGSKQPLIIPQVNAGLLGLTGYSPRASPVGLPPGTRLVIDENRRSRKGKGKGKGSRGGKKYSKKRRTAKKRKTFFGIF